MNTDEFQDPNNTCIKYICNGNNNWTYTEAGRLILTSNYLYIYCCIEQYVSAPVV